jgi:dCMP deaminase
MGGIMEQKHIPISWDEYFMGIALLSAKRSKDPNTQVGACIVDRFNKVVSIGYNGMPRGIDENKISWSKGEGLDSKYLYVCHAEMNAILNIRDGTRLRDTILYVTLYPCNECAKAIIQTGISEVVYLENKYAGTTMTKASALLFELAHIKVRKYVGELIDVILK